MRLKSKTQKGSVLLTVVVVSMMMMVIVAAGISMVGHTQDRTNQEYREKQAYFLAASSLKGFVSEVTRFGDGGSAAEVQANVEMVQSLIDKEADVEITFSDGTPLKDKYKRLNYGTGADDNCNCKIRVESVSGINSLRAIATANYLGEEAQVVAYFSIATPVASGSLSNALEFIGSTGGNNGRYNNLNVLGNTGAISTDSHDKNIVYKFTQNDVTMNGTTDILGSIAVGVQMELGTRFDYDPSKPVDEAGCVMNISRSAFFVKDQARIASKVGKARDYTGQATYNYINTGEALVVLGNYDDAKPFCGAKDYEVDIYTSGLIFGKINSNPFFDTSKGLGYALERSYGPEEESLHQYMNNLDGDGEKDLFDMGSNNQFHVFGNIYTYTSGDFNGDIYIAGKGAIHGDIYCSGDIYYTNELKVDGKIYLLSTDKKIYHNSSPVTPSNVEYLDWRSSPPNDRARRPEVKTEAAIEYLHEPESFFMVDMGTTLDDSYKSMYKASDPHVLRDDVPMIDIADLDKSAPLRNGRGGTYHTFTDSNGTVYTPTYYIRDSFILGNYNGTYDMQNYKYDDGKNAQDSSHFNMPRDGIMYIDLDGIDHDICIIMKDGCSFYPQGKMQIVVNPDPAGKHFVYFCSDSGLGTVTPNSLGGSTNVKTNVQYNTFKKNSTYRFWVDSRFYIVTKDLFTGIQTGKLKDYKPGYSNIYFFIGDTCKIEISPNDFLVEGTFYAPRADVKLDLGLQTVNIDYYDPSNPHSYTVLGAVMCKNFINDGNRSTIGYEEAAPNSLLPKIVKSKDLYGAGFKLQQYKAA